MEAKMKSGKVIKGRLAITFVNLGLATEIGVEEEVITSNTPKEETQDKPLEKLDNTPKEEVKSTRKRRTKAEIEADNKIKK